MPQLNQCNFIGNAGAAPIVKTFQDGGKIATVNIAVTERWKGRDGQPAERTEWGPLVFDGPLADVAEKYIEKGSVLYVSAKFGQRKYVNAEGVQKYITEFRVRELQLLGGKPAAAPAEAPAPKPQPQPEATTVTTTDPDLPF